ncbi:acetamidase/formamidase family protein [Picrophilus oshimae]|nr:acetamidase/formamidase family protein [Picrophilus oshimae]
MFDIDGFDDKNLHFSWNAINKPVIYINDGDVLNINIPDSSTNQIRYDSRDMKIDNSRVDAAVGPVYINGSEPGDAIEVEIYDIKTGGWGWSAIINNFGLLKNKYNERLFIWDIENGYARGVNFLKGIKIPLNPFIGIIGTAPALGKYEMIPPQHFGGNMDNRLIRSGSKVLLPVNVNGGLISFSDPHASQGDGEVCGTAIETSAVLKIKIRLIKNRNLKTPIIYSNENYSGNVIATTGINNDIYKAAVEATSEMINYLSRELNITEEESYILCSVAGNLRISEIVDEPNFVVSMVMPENVISK